MSKVLFDGVNKVIIVQDGVTELDFDKDVFSPWKDWFLQGTNSRFGIAISSDGGDDSVRTEGGKKGITFSLAWKIRPFEGHHRLLIYGNVYSADGSDPFIETLGNYKVTITMTVSSIVRSASGDVSASELDGIGGSEWTVTLA